MKRQNGLDQTVFPPPIYNFLRYADKYNAEKTVLDCGAGGRKPPLALFSIHGYETFGIDISDSQIERANDFASRHNLKLDIKKSDMRQIPFADESMSFIFSYNTIFHMTKQDIGNAMAEIHRVLKPQGLCFVNFLSVDSQRFGQGVEIGDGEFQEEQEGMEFMHSYFKDDEPDPYFVDFAVLHKEKRIRDQLISGERNIRAYIDYIAMKR